MGFGASTGGYFGGKLCDMFGIKKVAYGGSIFYALTCILSIVVSLIDVFPFSCFVCFSWGFLIYYVQSNEMVMCSKLFDGKYESFAIVKQFHCVPILLYYLISFLTDNSIEVKYLMTVLFFLSIPSLYLLTRLTENKENLLSVVTDEDHLRNDSS